MTDLKVSFKRTDTSFQFNTSLKTSDLETVDDVKSAVLYSLFTDRRAEDDDEIPDGTTDLRGYWGDSILPDDNDSEGSKLWLLKRQKATQETLNKAVIFVRESLQWMIDDDRATFVTVTGRYIKTGFLGLEIIIDLVDGTQYTDLFDVSI